MRSRRADDRSRLRTTTGRASGRHSHSDSTATRTAYPPYALASGCAPAGQDRESGARRAEELLEVGAGCFLVVAERGGRGENAQLRRIEPEGQPVEEAAEQHRNLGAGRALVAVQLVDDEMEARVVPLEVL